MAGTSWALGVAAGSKGSMGALSVLCMVKGFRLSNMFRMERKLELPLCSNLSAISCKDAGHCQWLARPCESCPTLPQSAEMYDQASELKNTANFCKFTKIKAPIK